MRVLQTLEEYERESITIPGETTLANATYQSPQLSRSSRGRLGTPESPDLPHSLCDAANDDIKVRNTVTVIKPVLFRNKRESLHLTASLQTEQMRTKCLSIVDDMLAEKRGEALVANAQNELRLKVMVSFSHDENCRDSVGLSFFFPSH